MTNKIKQMQPTEEQLKIMQEYANICSEALEIISRYEVNLASQSASIRLQESMQWFHAFILNGGKLLDTVSIN